MKLIIRKFLYVGSFYLLLFILSCFLLTFAVIYDFVIWLIEKLTKKHDYVQQSKFVNQIHPEISDEFYHNTIKELAQKLRS
ncbi:hypothetical protein CFPU101_22180 [Chroococcus sp. FPU101]|nr:hypothetical protein CFPU101_22180 [Chroococcus sp. FPU101]